jgi:hypothetical protein
LNNKLAWARVSIIIALDAIQNGQAATYIPSTQLSTMLIQHESHMFFPSHYHHGHRYGVHDPQAINYVVQAAVEEAFAARVDGSQHKRTPPPCR